jgi:hypothetical protein
MKARIVGEFLALAFICAGLGFWMVVEVAK